MASPAELADYGAVHPNILASAWIDGPYGGVDRPIEQLYDLLIIVTGGLGNHRVCSLGCSIFSTEEARLVRTI
jgi:hypothetical protein